MGSNVTGTTEYMTVGEMARKAGVSIRTLQYYDQKGLLSPSAKGIRNQRYYTDKDLESLYRIICYKYMGLSLSEIKEQLEKGDTDSQFTATLHQQVKEAEQAISEQIKRYAVLRDLETLDSKSVDPDKSWAHYSDTIDYIDNKWEMIWQLNVAYEQSTGVLEIPGYGSDEMKQYYKLIAKAANLKNQGIPATDDAVVELIEDYFRLKEVNESNGTWDTKRELMRIDPENIRMAFNEIADFWSDMKAYLREASDEYLKRQEEGKLK